MVDKNLEQRIRKAVNHATPDVLDRILTSCDEQKGIGMNMNNNVEKQVNRNIHRNKWFTPVVAVAAALLIISAGGFGINSWKVQHTINSTVMLDVNPSISLKVNAKERVISVEPHNEDGKIVLGDMDLKNTDLSVAVNALVGSMLQNGYLSDIQNAILVSVENDDYEKGSELQARIAQIIDNTLNSNQFEPSVLSQTVSADKYIKDMAERYNISEGKATLIQEMIQKDPTFTFDILASLSVSEIGLIMDSRSINSDNVTKTGVVSVKGYISEEDAKAIAYDHAKVSKNTVTEAKIKFDIEAGILVYELDFIVGTIEYEYDIHAVTGEIIKFTKDNESIPFNQDEDEDDDQDNDSQGENKDDDQDNDSQGENEDDNQDNDSQGVNEDDDQDNDSQGENKYDNQDNDSQGENEDGDNQDDNKVTQKPSATVTEYISKAKAKEIAFTHAKVKASQVKESDAKLEKKDKKAVYKVVFTTANGEYEYVIDATSGKVNKYAYDPINSKNTTSNSQGNNNQDNDNQGENNQDGNAQGEDNQDRNHQGSKNQDGNNQGENNQDGDHQGENNQDGNGQGENNQDGDDQGENNQDGDDQGENNQDGDDQGENNQDGDDQGEDN